MKKKKKPIVYSVSITPDIGGSVKTFSNITLKKFWTFTVLYTLLIILSTCLFIVYTPLRTLLPGYSFSDEKTKVIMSQQLRIDSLNRKMATIENYNQRVLSLFGTGSLGTPVQDGKPRGNNESAMNVKLTRLADIERKPIDGSSLLSIPIVRGRLSQKFSPLTSHYGIDISTSSNEPISVIADGVVLFSDWISDFGYTIIVQHDFIVSFYKHCNRILVREGEQVKKGQTIALAGNTGLESYGAHLHLEIWKDGVPQNPENYLHFER
ncbi:MAG: M23 family metallopeptidase [Chloroherpetonaceae bacterium]|nr:M23 family metallopeptidase [Chloroherpetonaceae bacterium]